MYMYLLNIYSSVRLDMGVMDISVCLIQTTTAILTRGSHVLKGAVKE